MPVLLFRSRVCSNFGSWEEATKARGAYDPDAEMWRKRIAFVDKHDQDTQIVAYKMGDAPDIPEIREQVHIPPSMWSSVACISLLVAHFLNFPPRHGY